ncbi:MAG: nitronate monooxygenase [Dehalococcoidia bacterium]
MSRPVLRTELCDILDIEYPVVLAGMAEHAGIELTAAVSEAGGLGVLGALPMSPDELDEAIIEIKKRTSKPFGVDSIAPLGLVEDDTPIDLKKLLEEDNGDLAPTRDYIADLGRRMGIRVPHGIKLGTNNQGFSWSPGMTKKQLEVIYDHNVPVFAAGLGSPEFMIDDAHKKGMKVIGVVGTTRQARAEAAVGVDIIVAQGTEGGGHTGKVATLPLVPQVVDAVHPTPVLAAGGIVDGRGLIAALSLGACGVWCGTAFLGTYEAMSHDENKRQIIAAGESDTTISKTMTGKTARCIKNPLQMQYEAENGPVLPFPIQVLAASELIQYMSEEDDTLKYYWTFAGQGCGLIRELRPAGDVLRSMVEEATRILEEELPSRVKWSR